MTPRLSARFWQTPAGTAVLLLSVLVVVLLAVELTDDSGPWPPGADHVASVPLRGQQEAQFELLSGATSVTVRTADLGSDLLLAATPLDAGIVPRTVDRQERQELHLVSTGEAGPSSVDVVLNSRVRWAVRLAGGATQQTVDLSQSRVSSVDFAAGATRIELRLPQPAGTVVIRMSGGASQFSVHTPLAVPSRVRIGGGAGSVSVNGEQRQGVGAGTVFTPAEWARATDRYDLDVTAGVATLSVARA